MPRSFMRPRATWFHAPSKPYARRPGGARQVLSVANLTRQDGRDFLRLAPQVGIVTKTAPYMLRRTNEALADLRTGPFEGAAVLVSAN